MFGLFREGISVGYKRLLFLGCSNNQVRDHGFFLVAPSDGITVDAIRDWAGNLDGITNVAKYLSRLGQVFSTTTNTVEAKSSDCLCIPDIERNGYCFTDGIGMISPDLAKEVSLVRPVNFSCPCRLR